MWTSNDGLSEVVYTLQHLSNIFHIMENYRPAVSANVNEDEEYIDICGTEATSTNSP